MSTIPPPRRGEPAAKIAIIWKRKGGTDTDQRQAKGQMEDLRGKGAAPWGRKGQTVFRKVCGAMWLRRAPGGDGRANSWQKWREFARQCALEWHERHIGAQSFRKRERGGSGKGGRERRGADAREGAAGSGAGTTHGKGGREGRGEAAGRAAGSGEGPTLGKGRQGAERGRRTGRGGRERSGADDREVAAGSGAGTAPGNGSATEKPPPF